MATRNATLARLVEATEDYWKRVEPLLGDPAEIIEQEDHMFLGAGGRIGAAFSSSLLDPERDLEAAWGALETYRALPLFACPPLKSDVAGLLAVLGRRSQSKVSEDACASVSWPAIPGVTFPSCDGYQHLTNLAVCPNPLALERPSSRNIGFYRLDYSLTSEVAQLWMRLVQEESRWGAVRPRPTTGFLLRQRVNHMAASGDNETILVEFNGILAGFISGHRVHSNSSIRRRTAFPRVFYIDALYVDPRHRRHGLARALVSEAVFSESAIGVDGFALHYSQRSPTAIPFWTSIGFRTLWQTWRMTLPRPETADPRP